MNHSSEPFPRARCTLPATAIIPRAMIPICHWFVDGEGLISKGKLFRLSSRLSAVPIVANFPTEEMW
jgi:hypothetical protein